MKASEKALVDLLNRNNAMKIAPERLVLGIPKVHSDIRGANTIIEVTAVDDDPRYEKSMAFTYTRIVGSTLNLLAFSVDSTDDYALGLSNELTEKYNLATEPADLIVRSVVEVDRFTRNVVFDLYNHPLMYGYVVARITIPEQITPLEDIIKQNVFDGFTFEQLN